MGSCPKAMASMMEGSFLGVETSLRRAVVSEEDKQKGELLQNMCARLLNMLSPPGWLRIKDVQIRHHKWMYFPLGHLHTHFLAQITVQMTVRQDRGENNSRAPQPVELIVCVPLDSPLHEVIHRALAVQSSGRLGSFRQQVTCTLDLPSRTHTHRIGPPIPHDTTLREVVVGAVGHIEQPVESYGHGPFPQTSDTTR